MVEFPYYLLFSSLCLIIYILGGIVSVHTFGVPFIFVYSDEIAQEMFVKHGAAYSDRPPFHVANL